MRRAPGNAGRRNIELLEEVGPDNAFIFGLNADEVGELRSHYERRPTSSAIRCYPRC